MTKTTAPPSPARVPWNRGRIIGPKPPLKPKYIWAIRTRLQHDSHVRDLATFNGAIGSKLRVSTRGCRVGAQTSIERSSRPPLTVLLRGRSRELPEALLRATARA